MRTHCLNAVRIQQVFELLKAKLSWYNAGSAVTHTMLAKAMIAMCCLHYSIGNCTASCCSIRAKLLSMLQHLQQRHNVITFMIGSSFSRALMPFLNDVNGKLSGNVSAPCHISISKSSVART
jgi:hypothetical protein